VPQSEEMTEWKAVLPTEANGFRFFGQELEDDPLVLFHATPSKNFDSIVRSGFRSARSMEIGPLSSVSYAKRSSSCLAHMGNEAQEDYVIFAVKFESLEQRGVRNNQSDIHVDDENLQPRILGYCRVPQGFRAT
jgi:hypothetical protein